MPASDALRIYTAAVRACLPDKSVQNALKDLPLGERVTVFAIGKAAHRMASAAVNALSGRVCGGIVITKHGHVPAPIPGLICMEAGHPVPNENSVTAARAALRLADSLTADDTALVLLSGGGSALFELPADGVTLAEMAFVTGQLLRSGAGINEINCMRKHLSQVKGGRFAAALAPARVFTVALSDVLSDAPDVIASGPTCADLSTVQQALRIAEKYRLTLSASARTALCRETPKQAAGEMRVSGSVRHLCLAARAEAARLGYAAKIVDTALTGEARVEGARIAALSLALPARTALIFGGETVVHVTGQGLGGRCQEFALGGAAELAENCALLAAGSDGTDGPTDAAGAVITSAFRAQTGAAAIRAALDNNDAYPLLDRHDALIRTGATGTNVNDLYLLLKA